MQYNSRKTRQSKQMKNITTTTPKKKMISSMLEFSIAQQNIQNRSSCSTVKRIHKHTTNSQFAVLTEFGIPAHWDLSRSIICVWSASFDSYFWVHVSWPAYRNAVERFFNLIFFCSFYDCGLTFSYLQDIFKSESKTLNFVIRSNSAMIPQNGLHVKNSISELGKAKSI